MGFLQLFADDDDKISIGGAGGIQNVNQNVNPITTTDVGHTIMVNILFTAYFIAGAIAVIVIIVAGIYYATSGGNSSVITKAKNALTYAIVGLVVVMIAAAITSAVSGIFK